MSVTSQMPRKAAAQHKPGMLSAEAQKIAASEFGNDMLVGTTGLFSSIGMNMKPPAIAPKYTGVSLKSAAPEHIIAARQAGVSLPAATKKAVKKPASRKTTSRKTTSRKKAA